MKKCSYFTLILVALSLLCGLSAEESIRAPSESIVAPSAATSEEIADVKMVAEHSAIQPGKPFWICFQFRIAPDWHLYWKNPGEAGLGPVVNWSLPPGFQAEELLWSAPERITLDQNVLFGYSEQLFLLAKILPPNDLELGSTVQIGADLDWLGCSTICVPGKNSFQMTLDVSNTTAPQTKQVLAIFKQARRSLPLESRHIKARIADGIFEVRLTQNRPFEKIKSVFFFPEQQGLLDVHLYPSWELSANKRTLVTKTYNAIFNDSQVTFPFKGVLLVEEEGPSGIKRLAYNINIVKPTHGTSAPSTFEKKYETLQESATKSVDGHLEDLEAKVWYRRLLTDFSQFLRSDLFKVLLYAFIGGIILNIMPCVLPVISFKLLHFVQLQNVSRMTVVKHGVMYSFGVLISFWALATTIFALQSFGKVIGWGFQLQEPIFVAILTIILFLLGLCLFGVFELGTSLSSTAGAWEQSFKKRIPTSSPEASLGASFFSGVLATLVATPCTGPLLGSAIGFAATLQPTYSFAVFSALGLGMAFPFLLISFFPGLIKLLPKPGRWMVTFKQLMGFFMLATVLWLVWVLDAQTENLSVLSLLICLFIVAMGAWIYGTWGSLDREKRTRHLAILFAIAFIGVGSWILLSSIEHNREQPNQPSLPISQVVGKDWETFSQPRLDRLVQNGVPVFVAVGAKWCLTCQTNHVVLETDKVKEAFVHYGVVKMYADWTMNDESVTRYLRSLGRNGVPVYALYGRDPGAKPTILPELITPDMVVEALANVHEQDKVDAKKE